MELAAYLKEALKQDPAFDRVVENLQQGQGPLTLRMAESLTAPLLAALPDAVGRLMVAVAPGVEAAERLLEELGGLLEASRLLYLPMREMPLPGREVVDLEGSATRARALYLLDAWRKKKGKGAPLLMLPAQALAHPAGARASASAPLSLRRGAPADLEELEDRLASFGYRRQYQVEAPGDFSVRGGILDVYDPTHPFPFRLELDGDTLERLRFFNPADQRSRAEGPETSGALEALIFPLDWEGREEGALELNSLFSPEDGLVAIEPRSARERLDGLEDGERAREAYENLMQRRHSLILDPWSGEAVLELESRQAPDYRGDVQTLLHDIKSWRGHGWRVLITFETEGRRERVSEVLAEAGLAARDHLSARAGLVLSPGRLHHGFTLPLARLVVLTEEDLFGAMPRRRWETEATSGRTVASLGELEEGDHVVHLHHGVGVFSGLTMREVGGSQREYAVLRYAEGDVLYLPTDRIGLIHRYVGAENPSLYRLSSAQWRKTRKRARAAVRDIATDLLRLYAEREAAGGFAFSPDVPWQQELESSFPYRETPDQMRAIEDVKADMERPMPMDRLVYGDVGYGKTEVALRAAFKAAMDSRQVAVLVPTTVLALQHGETFRNRFLPWPVRVETFTRFQTPRERKVILEGLASGAVDVVIGTHSLLQPRVAFSDLGLVVVDEEHRFGVLHKERLKELRREVDVLTLTATPIPRTLQMSLSGLRDMSTIDTPIEDRYAVVTTVGIYDEGMVRESIERELEREGQVFYLYNLVEGIEAKAERIRRLVPRAKVAVGHGQMGERELEKVMHDFMQGRLDVLVCTTIVESGLDIPNANTLIVDGAERLGLAQLYHLRGRIGRGHRQAYGFFLFREGSRLTDAAFQRLRVIRDFTELGSGLRVALKDLEIRGAGNMLGAEQHGQVEAVGFELYCRMLQEAVEALKGEPHRHMPLITVDLPLAAHLPREYIEHSARRIEVYRRMVEAQEEDELADLEAEVRDRYGPPPSPVTNLFAIARLRLACVEPGVREMVWSRDRVTLRFRRGAQEFQDRLHAVNLRGLLGKEAGALRFNSSTREIELPLDGKYWEKEDALQRLRELLDTLKAGGGEVPGPHLEASRKS